MVFTSDEQGNVTSWTDLDAETYSTPEEAEEGHRQMIEKWKEMEIDGNRWIVVGFHAVRDCRKNTQM